MDRHAKYAPETLAAQALHAADSITGAVNPPIQPSSTFARDAEYRLRHGEQGYGRADNPGYQAAEQLMTALEGGEAAMLMSSGMAAASSVIECLSPGDHVVAPRIMYWGLRNWLTDFCEQWGLGLDFYDALDPEALAASVRPGATRLVWVETPCNPSWDVIDIRAAADIAHAAGARLVVDSTAATPVLTRPISLGADLVMHSGTKYLNGHSDAIAGVLVTAREDEFWQRLLRRRSQAGAIAGSLESYLLQRGLRTLFLRVRRCSESALHIARHFSDHPKVASVIYPGLPNHPGHDIARRQMEGGFGGMMSMQVRGGRQAALDVIGRCRLFIPATSFGGVESLVEHRHSIEGENSPVPPDWLRLSIGIEAVEDLVADLEQALG